jgi:hypothetical protein
LSPGFAAIVLGLVLVLRRSVGALLVSVPIASMVG